jgi:two-component system sensor histidine kinase ChiS
MKDRFISIATHELRTPLVSIKGYVDYILLGKIGQLPEKIASSLEVVRRNTDRLLYLTDDLLDIQRISSGRLQLTFESLNLREIIENCIEEAQPFLSGKKQSLHLEVPERLLMVKGDCVRLSQVLANLLHNASKFTPEGSSITLRMTEEKDMIRVQIYDTGIGIRKEYLSEIFQPFANIPKSNYTKGTGLGLSVTKGLVEAHGGKIWAESAGEGKGAAFTFTLPKLKAT